MGSTPSTALPGPPGPIGPIGPAGLIGPQGMPGVTPDLSLYAVKSSTMWCATGELCKVPSTSPGLQIGTYSIKPDTINKRICLYNNNVGNFCIDDNGMIVKF